MHWPHLPAESVRPSRFNPPFCPWPECAAHKGPGSGFQRYGSYQKPSDYRRTCSRQTFSTTYYLKRPELLVAVASGLAACSAHRQIARSCHCAKTSVTRMAERLGRHAIVHDHWEVFIGRQDRALGIGTAVGATSWFVYDIDPAPHRGSGRRPDRTKEKETASPPKCSYIKSIRRTFRGLIPHVSADRRLVCNMDGRTDYIVAARAPDLRHRVDLRIYPNPVRGPKGTPRSPEAVVRDHAMFVVDSLHQFLRHTYRYAVVLGAGVGICSCDLSETMDAPPPRACSQARRLAWGDSTSGKNEFRSLEVAPQPKHQQARGHRGSAAGRGAGQPRESPPGIGIPRIPVERVAIRGGGSGRVATPLEEHPPQHERGRVSRIGGDQAADEVFGLRTGVHEKDRPPEADGRGL